MDLAVREGLNDIVSLLLENGANIATDLQYYNYCLISMMPLTSHYMQNWSIQIYQSEGGLGLLF